MIEKYSLTHFSNGEFLFRNLDKDWLGVLQKYMNEGIVDEVVIVWLEDKIMIKNVLTDILDGFLVNSIGRIGYKVLAILGLSISGTDRFGCSEDIWKLDYMSVVKLSIGWMIQERAENKHWIKVLFGRTTSVADFYSSQNKLAKYNLEWVKLIKFCSITSVIVVTDPFNFLEFCIQKLG